MSSAEIHFHYDPRWVCLLEENLHGTLAQDESALSACLAKHDVARAVLKREFRGTLVQDKSAPSACLAKHEVAERQAQRIQIWEERVDGGRQREALTEALGDVGQQARGLSLEISQRRGRAQRKGRAEVVAKAAC